jgi:hypothetical protein
MVDAMVSLEQFFMAFFVINFLIKIIIIIKIDAFITVNNGVFFLSK